MSPQRRQQRFDDTGDRHGVFRVSLVRRHERRFQERRNHQVADIQQYQHEPGYERTGKQIAHRHGLRRKNPHGQLRLLVSRRQYVAEHDEHDRGRDDLSERARSANGAGRDFRRVAAAQHGRQGQEPHRHDRRSDYARAGSQQHAHQRDGDTETAAQAAEQTRQRIEELLGNACAFERYPHEDEQRHGNQRFVAHDAEDTVWQTAQERLIEDPCGNAGPGKDQCRAPERKGHRKAGQEHEDDRQEQKAGNPLHYEPLLSVATLFSNRLTP